MALIDRLLALRGPLHGGGINHEGEAFTATLAIDPLVGGRAAMLHYAALGPDGTPVHTEATLLALAPDGTPCLWPVMDELPVVLPHPQVARDDTHDADGTLRAVFASGPRAARDTFREEITITLHADGTLTYAHAWGLPGEDFDDRSSARLTPPERPCA
jgi:hypothetical protein